MTTRKLIMDETYPSETTWSSQRMFADRDHFSAAAVT